MVNKISIGYILICVKPLKEHEVYNQLLRNKKIVEVHPLFGEYDLIVKIEIDNFEELGKVVIEEIRSLDGVIDTKTLTGTNF